MEEERGRFYLIGRGGCAAGFMLSSGTYIAVQLWYGGSAWWLLAVILPLTVSVYNLYRFRLVGADDDEKPRRITLWLRKMPTVFPERGVVALVLRGLIGSALMVLLGTLLFWRDQWAPFISWPVILLVLLYGSYNYYRFYRVGRN